jgi:glycosyltransferase involved in cell wall biosynthesis
MANKIKVLWFCNVNFSGRKSISTGSWLHSMAESLVDTNEIELFNITQGNVNRITSQNYKVINQWIIPIDFSHKKGLPNFRIIKGIQQIIGDVKPDIIHIWGTENYWGLLYSRGFIKGKVLIDIQGLKYACAKYFYSGLSLIDVIRCFNLKEFLRPSSSLLGLKMEFERWGKFEKEMLLKIGYISTQSEWVRTYVRNINCKAKLFETQLALRNEFLNASCWNIDLCVPNQIFTSVSSSSISYKGLHIIIDAIVILKTKFPDVKLCIAGNISKGIRKDGYTKWLFRKIERSGIRDNIIWLGSLDAQGLVTQLQRANVVVIPSFIETYCLALDEALTVGAPCVVSFAGAMPELAIHEKTALFYPPGDIDMCASAVERILIDKDLTISISENSYYRKKIRNNEFTALNQLNIYRELLNS